MSFSVDIMTAMMTLSSWEVFQMKQVSTWIENRKSNSSQTEAPLCKEKPSLDQWMNEVKRAPDADQIGMYLVHNGVVRGTARSQVREGDRHAKPVSSMRFSYDKEKVAQAVAAAEQMEGIYAIRVWLNQGMLRVGDDIMMVLIGADIRPHAVQALEVLVGRIKSECVSEEEQYA